MDSCLRTATPADQGVLLELIRDYYAHDSIPFHAEEMAAGLATLLRDPSLGRGFLIISARRIAGYVILTFSFDLEFGGRMGTITDFYLRSEFRRHGLGRMALQEMEAASAKLGLASLELQPNSSNEAALAFYRKMGFIGYDRATMCKKLKG